MIPGIIIIIISLVLLLSTTHVLCFQIYNGQSNDSYFVPFAKGFTGIAADATNYVRERVNEGAFYTADQEILFEGAYPRQICPGMVGPFSDGSYYCSAKEYGYCDRRSGTCFCKIGYEGIDCTNCQETHFRVGNLCYPKKLCHNNCNDGGECNFLNGTCSCLPHRTGKYCETLLCSIHDVLCESCTIEECLSCFGGYYINGFQANSTSLYNYGNNTKKTVCSSCYDFDPRCAGCTLDDGCTVCADPVLTSVLRSGYRSFDHLLPIEDQNREFSITLPFGTKSVESFAEAENFVVVLSQYDTPLNYNTTSCSQGIYFVNSSSDSSLQIPVFTYNDTWICNPVQSSYKVCGHYGVFKLAYPNYRVSESYGLLPLTVMRSGGGFGKVTITYGLKHITTTDSDVKATASYTTTQKLTFDYGEIEKTFLIEILEDNVVEDNEVFQIFLQNPEGGGSLGAQYRANVTIVDNDLYQFSPSRSRIIINDNNNNFDLRVRAGSNFSVDIDARIHYFSEELIVGGELFYAVIENFNDLNSNLVQRNSQRKICQVVDNSDGTYTVTCGQYPEGSLFEQGKYHLYVYQASPEGILGQYYSDGFFQNLILERTDTSIDFFWGVGNLLPTGGSNYISIRWTGLIKVPTSDLYWFKLDCDDFGRLWIDGTLLIDNWHETGTYLEVPKHFLYLDSSSFHEIIVEYLELADVAFAKLYWGVLKSIDEFSELLSTNLNSYFLLEEDPFIDLTEEKYKLRSNCTFAWKANASSNSSLCVIAYQIIPSSNLYRMYELSTDSPLLVTVVSDYTVAQRTECYGSGLSEGISLQTASFTICPRDNFGNLRDDEENLDFLQDQDFAADLYYRNSSTYPASDKLIALDFNQQRGKYHGEGSEYIQPLLKFNTNTFCFDGSYTPRLAGVYDLFITYGQRYTGFFNNSSLLYQLNDLSVLGSPFEVNILPGKTFGPYSNFIANSPNILSPSLSRSPTYQPSLYPIGSPIGSPDDSGYALSFLTVAGKCYNFTVIARDQSLNYKLIGGEKNLFDVYLYQVDRFKTFSPPITDEQKISSESSLSPSNLPSSLPTTHPSSLSPSATPTSRNSKLPSSLPTFVPSKLPSTFPTLYPTIVPTCEPSDLPTVVPTSLLSKCPSSVPVTFPTCSPSNSPTVSPTAMPSVSPTDFPSLTPSTAPTSVQTNTPTVRPTISPTIIPTRSPTIIPTANPSSKLSFYPSVIPSLQPSFNPPNILLTSTSPTCIPSSLPSFQPSVDQHWGIPLIELQQDTLADPIIRFGTVYDMRNGNYTIEICPLIAGVFEFHILFKGIGISNQPFRINDKFQSLSDDNTGSGSFRGQYVDRSPYTVIVTHGQASPFTSTAKGPGLVSSVVGVPNYFVITVRDAWDNVIRTPSRDINAFQNKSFDNSRGSIYPYSVEVTLDRSPQAVVNLFDFGNGSIHVEYIAAVSDWNTISVYIDSQHIQGSPYSLMINDGEASARFTYAAGKGLVTGTAGYPSFFELYSFDLDNNRKTSVFEVGATNATSNLGSEVIYVYKMSGANNITGLMIPCPILETELKLSESGYVCNIFDTFRGHYYGTYTPIYAGKSKLSVFLNTNTSYAYWDDSVFSSADSNLIEISNSPFTIDIMPGDVISTHSSIRGDVYDCVAGEVCKVSIQLYDAYRNKLVYGGNSIELALTPKTVFPFSDLSHYPSLYRPTYQERYLASIVDNLDGSYLGYYNIPLYGSYEMIIFVAMKGLNASYFNFSAFATSDINIGFFESKNLSSSAYKSRFDGKSKSDIVNLVDFNASKIRRVCDVASSDQTNSILHQDRNDSFTSSAIGSDSDNFNRSSSYSGTNMCLSPKYISSALNPRDEYYSMRYIGLVKPLAMPLNCDKESYKISVELDSQSFVSIYIGHYRRGLAYMYSHAPQGFDVLSGLDLIIQVNDDESKYSSDYTFYSANNSTTEFSSMYTLVIEYDHFIGSAASLSLFWQSSTMPNKTLIPETNLFHWSPAVDTSLGIATEGFETQDIPPTLIPISNPPLTKLSLTPLIIPTSIPTSYEPTESYNTAASNPTTFPRELRNFPTAHAYTTTIRPSTVSPSNTIVFRNTTTGVYSDATTGFVTSAGTSTTLTIIARDTYGNLLSLSTLPPSHLPKLLAIGPDNSIIREKRVVESSFGVYLLTFVPIHSGEYRLFVTIGCCVPPSNLKNIPSLLTVFPNTNFPSSYSVSYGSGLVGGIAGELLSINVTYRDVFENPTSIFEEEGFLNSSNNNFQPSKFSVDRILDNFEFKLKFIRIRDYPQSDPVNFVDSKDSSFQLNEEVIPNKVKVVKHSSFAVVTYNMTLIGTYKLFISILYGKSLIESSNEEFVKKEGITFDSNGETAVSDKIELKLIRNPYIVSIRADRPVAKNTVVTGPGKKYGHLNQSAKFNILLKDAYLNPVLFYKNISDIKDEPYNGASMILHEDESRDTYFTTSFSRDIYVNSKFNVFTRLLGDSSKLSRENGAEILSLENMPSCQHAVYVHDDTNEDKYADRELFYLRNHLNKPLITYYCSYTPKYSGFHQLVVQLIDNHLSQDSAGRIQINFYSSSDVTNPVNKFYTTLLTTIHLNIPSIKYFLLQKFTYLDNSDASAIMLNDFGVTWFGFILIPKSNAYEFTSIHKNFHNIRVYIDDTEVYDSENLIKVEIFLTQDTVYRLRIVSSVEIRNEVDDAYLEFELRWRLSKYSSIYSSIPSSSLFSNREDVYGSPFNLQVL